MLKMKVPVVEALKHLKLIDHRTCQKGILTRWHVRKDQSGKDFVTAQSICWLFCWAKTGMNSETARGQARRAFNAIFDQTFDRLERRLDHEWAIIWRYEKSNIEKNFYSHIASK